MSRNAMEREEVLNRRMEKKVVTLQPNPRMSKVARVIQVASIPVVIGYFVFVMDFGEKEHVFSPVRRWVDQQKSSFWTLSPSERQAVTALTPPAPPPPTSSSQPT